MQHDIKKLIISLAVIIGSSIPLHRAISYSINDLVNVSGIQNNELYNKSCKAQSIVDGLTRLQGAYVEQLIQDTIKDIKDVVKNYLFQLAWCVASGFDKEVDIPYVGTMIVKGPNCDYAMHNPALAAIKRAALNHIKNDFMARCLGRSMFSTVEDDVRRIIQENGPDGGKAYEEDWVSLPAIETKRAENRFHAILVNTPICPGFKDQVYAYYGVPQRYIDSPPPIDKNGYSVDGGIPFTLKGACSLPNGLTPEVLDSDWTKNGGNDALQLLMKPENNFNGFVSMASEERMKQVEVGVKAAENARIAGSGYSGLYQCIRSDGVDNSPGHCLEAKIIQPGSALNNQDMAIKQGNIDWMTNSQTANSMMGDIRQRIVSGLLSANERALDIPIQFDESSQEAATQTSFTPLPDLSSIPIPSGWVPPAPTGGPNPTPNPTGGPNPTPTGGPMPTPEICSGMDPRCLCVRDQANQYGYLRDLVGQATEAATIQQSGYMVIPVGCVGNGCSVMPGQEHNFLEAISRTNFGIALGARPNGPDTLEELLIDLGGDSLSFKVISPNGQVLVPGEPIAFCPAEVTP